jgi:hypothetical protein
MGVYYKPYFTINNPDSKGKIIFSIIMQTQYNIAKTNIIRKKGAIISQFRAGRVPFKELKGLFFRKNIAAA